MFRAEPANVVTGAALARLTSERTTLLLADRGADPKRAGATSEPTAERRRL